MLLYSLQRGVYGRSCLWIGAVSAVLSNIRRTTPWNGSGSVDLILLFQGTLLYFSQGRRIAFTFVFLQHTRVLDVSIYLPLSLSQTRIYLNLNNSQFYSTERINWFPRTHTHTHSRTVLNISKLYQRLIDSNKFTDEDRNDSPTTFAVSGNALLVEIFQNYFL